MLQPELILDPVLVRLFPTIMLWFTLPVVDVSCESRLLIFRPAMFLAVGLVSLVLPGTVGLPNVSSLRVLLNPSLLHWRLKSFELTGAPFAVHRWLCYCVFCSISSRYCNVSILRLCVAELTVYSWRVCISRLEQPTRWLSVLLCFRRFPVKMAPVGSGSGAVIGVFLPLGDA